MTNMLSIVIPVYNSDRSLRRLVDEIREELCLVNIKYEIIFVDDGSQNPSTWQTIRDLHSQLPQIIRGARLMTNFGKSSAVLCGFSMIKGTHVLTMDDDGQHDPKYISEFWTKREHDIVIGRFLRKKHSPIKRAGSRVKGWFDMRFIGKPKGVYSGPYKLINTKLVLEINKMKVVNAFVSALLFSLTSDIVNVDVEHRQRRDGKTGFSLSKMISQFSNLLFNNSSFLLRCVSYCGIILSFGSFLLGVIFAFKYGTYGVAVRGWTSTILIILFTNGIVLFSLGVFGEYFIRIIKLAENRPSFAIRESLGNEEIGI